LLRAPQYTRRTSPPSDLALTGSPAGFYFASIPRARSQERHGVLRWAESLSTRNRSVRTPSPKLRSSPTSQGDLHSARLAAHPDALLPLRPEPIRKCHVGVLLVEPRSRPETSWCPRHDQADQISQTDDPKR